MILSKQNLAIGLVGLASLTWVGVSSALEAGDPVLDDEVVVLDDEVADLQDDCTDEADEADDTATDDEDEATEDEATEDASTEDAAVEDAADEDECAPEVEGDDDEVIKGADAVVVIDEVDDEGAETEAAEHPENHGKYVSEAARETCPSGPGHGQCVRAVAQSDAGKSGADAEGDALEGDDAVDDSTEDADDDAEIEVEDEDDVEGATAPAAPDAGNERDKGNGNGKGKG